MRILHLGLTNFRNYSRLELDLPAGIVLLQGDNAQGKTNLLEAIYYLSRLRSPRTGTDRELVNWLALEEDIPFARLVAQFQRTDRVERIELSLVQSSENGIDPNASAFRKHIRINGANKRALDAIGLLNAVLFLPQDIDLVAGSPHPRRRYLDDVICQVDSAYRRELQHYERVLAQRNYLLRSLRGRGYDAAQLRFWDERLVGHGAHITMRRQQVIRQLDESIQRIHLQLTGEAEQLRLQYRASVRLERPGAAIYQTALPIEPDASPSADTPALLHSVASFFSDQLAALRTKELEQGVSLVGPHRDDLAFLANGVDMNTYGSRGQQRTIALSLKLAEVELVTQEKRDKPVLLLDDVISELDAGRRNCLLGAIDSAQQVVVTTDDLLHYSREFIARATLWRVHAGRLEGVTSP